MQYPSNRQLARLMQRGVWKCGPVLQSRTRFVQAALVGLLLILFASQSRPGNDRRLPFERLVGIRRSAYEVPEVGIAEVGRASFLPTELPRSMDSRDAPEPFWASTMTARRFVSCRGLVACRFFLLQTPTRRTLGSTYRPDLEKPQFGDQTCHTSKFDYREEVRVRHLR